MLVLLITSMLVLALKIQPVRAIGPITINADGSITPQTAPITSIDNVTYTFTGNIIAGDYDGVEVERSNIKINGNEYTIQGPSPGTRSIYGIAGFRLSGINNITIQNTNIKGFNYAITLNSSSHSSISGNNITNNSDFGIWLKSSSDNNINGNNVTNDFIGYPDPTSSSDVGIGLYYYSNNNSVSGNRVTNNVYGIRISSSSNNSVSGNNVANARYSILLEYSSNNNSFSGNDVANNDVGIGLHSSCNSNIVSGSSITNSSGTGIAFESSSNNTVSGNDIRNNAGGIWLDNSSDNSIYHNNFVGNTQQVYTSVSTNLWDNGYSSGGNYWSNYTGIDLKSGPKQDQPGSDGIGDTPYIIDTNNTDHYPLMKLYVTPPLTQHDVAIADLTLLKTILAKGFNTNVNVTVQNLGKSSESFNVTASANSTIFSGLTVNITVPSGDYAYAALMWNTTSVSYGNYTISAYAWPVSGETDTADNTFVGGSVLVTIPGDLNGDSKVTLSDLVILANAYGTTPASGGKPGVPHAWNPNADINGNDKVDLSDLVLLALHYGQHYP
jgi:parallel beta-helix repeat protein